MARPPAIEQEPGLWLALNIRSLALNDDQLLQLFRDNPGFRFEVSARGELIIMSPASPKTGQRNAAITAHLWLWNRQVGAGEAFDSSTMFTLPNGARRSPDGSWVSKERWNRLSEGEKDSLTHMCPDFVIELRSKSDRLAKLKEKMEEYIANGARLAWLLDPIDRCAYLYRPGQAVERIDNPSVISGDPVLPGFRFDFREIL